MSESTSARSVSMTASSSCSTRLSASEGGGPFVLKFYTFARCDAVTAFGKHLFY